MSEQERQADEYGRGEGETRGTLVAEANHATMESKSRRAGAGLRRRDDDGRTTAERSYMAFLKSQEKTRSVARRRGRREVGTAAQSGWRGGRGGEGRQPGSRALVYMHMCARM